MPAGAKGRISCHPKTCIRDLEDSPNSLQRVRGNHLAHPGSGRPQHKVMVPCIQPSGKTNDHHNPNQDSHKIRVRVKLNPATRFHTFVANRLAVIHNKTEPQRWRYVNTSENPADEASRGQEVKAFLQNQRWLRGPQFLWAPECEWPKSPSGMDEPPHDPEVKVNSQSKGDL
ncbi:hypothetical protein Bbelb_317440 [Branchiostoma belcheri]|nr:hypothetical protein Bbelb_317440 [Branchiostoma belcheri]